MDNENDEDFDDAYTGTVRIILYMMIVIFIRIVKIVPSLCMQCLRPPRFTSN